MTDAEIYVRERWPQAECSGPWINGKIKTGGWYVIRLAPAHSTSSTSGIFGGQEVTEIAAWADAANRLERESILENRQS